MATNPIIISKVTLAANSDELQVNFSSAFASIPYVNISSKENVNVYLIEITKSYFKLKTSDSVPEDTEIHYVAIEKV
jgi:hypothetical protein